MADLIDAFGGQLVMVGEVTAALVLGGVIGLERELSDKPAGMRTHMLVAAAAALLVGLSDVMVETALAGAVEPIRMDPIRAIEAIATAVAVLGAGTILRPGNEPRVEGLTTAASLFFTAGVGIACALGQFVVAAGATLLILVTLRVLGKLAHRHDAAAGDG